MKIEFAVGMGRNERIDEVAELSRVAEESGFAHITFVDEPFMARDAHVMCTIAALSTNRIRIGQGVVDPVMYHPSVLANATATLSELSGGRAFLGIGAGSSTVKMMNAMPASQLREVIVFIKKLLAGETVGYKGWSERRSEWIRRPTPVYMAAEGPRALEIAGELADGVYFMGGPPAHVKWKVDHIHRGAERAGRDPTKIDICVRTVVYVTDSKEKAFRELSGFVPFRIRWLEPIMNDPEIAEMTRNLEREHPGILDEMRAFRAAADMHLNRDGYNPLFEKKDPPYANLMTQRIIDNVHQVGRVEDICEGIYKLAQAGVTTIATATYTIIDKKGMLKEISDKIMPHFRN